MESGIYCITNTINNKVYIGQSWNFEKRKIDHKCAYKRIKNSHLYNAINKYGWEKFNFEFIHKCDNQEIMDRAEIAYIKAFGAMDKSKGYNKVEGGQGGKKSLETIEKIKISLSGENHPMYGKKHPPETIEKIRIGNKGKHTEKKSFETKEKISIALLGHKISSETKEKISNAMLGHKTSPETIEKIKKKLQGVPWSKARRDAYNRKKNQIS